MSVAAKRSNQALRSRKDLLTAAGRLMKQGRKPTMDEVAVEALVSRATAYRHFPSIEALLLEVPVDASVIDVERMFAHDTSDDAEDRVDRAEASLHEAIYQNEAQMRVFLANAIRRDLTDDAVPGRQNRRGALIEAALATSRQRLADAEYEKLCASLALIFGPESMIVCRDVIRIGKDSARSVKSWAVRALVRAALADSAAGKPHKPKAPSTPTAARRTRRKS